MTEGPWAGSGPAGLPVCWHADRLGRYPAVLLGVPYGQRRHLPDLWGVCASVTDGGRAASLRSGAGREWALHGLVGAWPPQPSGTARSNANHAFPIPRPRAAFRIRTLTIDPVSCTIRAGYSETVECIQESWPKGRLCTPVSVH